MTSQPSNDWAQNRDAWNRLAAESSPFAKPATDAELARPLAALDSRGWLPGDVSGLKVLCLAAGGGWQAILYAAAGAEVTVFDLSDAMLSIDRREAERRQLRVRTVEGSMDDLSAFRDAEFDIVHQPVSTCYVPDLAKVYREIARVAREDGLYISQHKQPTSLQVSHRDAFHRHVLGVSYYHRGPLPALEDVAYREEGAVEYLHRWQDLVGGLCRAGFVVEDLVEPRRGDPLAPPGHFGHRGMTVAPYVRIKARRTSATPTFCGRTALWVPDAKPE
ncbi:MAG: class I SAM-dependent methyltransferase [Planctomyces sp.]|nr:class I SAM-dependent methyltransferase [Planctomyces sp.]